MINLTNKFIRRFDFLQRLRQVDTATLAATLGFNDERLIFASFAVRKSFAETGTKFNIEYCTIFKFLSRQLWRLRKKYVILTQQANTMFSERSCTLSDISFAFYLDFVRASPFCNNKNNIT